VIAEYTDFVLDNRAVWTAWREAYIARGRITEREAARRAKRAEPKATKA